jgi:hypothetical protein
MGSSRFAAPGRRKWWKRDGGWRNSTKPGASPNKPRASDENSVYAAFTAPTIPASYLILFYEYFHGDNGAGLGASHQTGWTGLVAKLIQQVYTEQRTKPTGLLDPKFMEQARDCR